MKILSTVALLAAFSVKAMAQVDTITNPGFERWGNVSPGISGATGEPTTWYSNKSGSSIASIGPQTCFKDSTDPHSGLYCVKAITESYIGTAVNGSLTTGIVNAPSFTKSSGYIGTINYSNSSDIRRMAFNGRPDSLVGWYQYTPGASTERAKVRAILHIGNYFDPEAATTYHPDPTDSQVGSALFLTDTPGTAVSTWTRFSVPFNYTTGLYASDSTPDYIMINVTSSYDQETTISGSTLLIDDLGVIYNTTSCATVTGLAASAITEMGATISWTAASGTVAGYVYAVTTSATPPVSGTFTTTTTVPVTGLTPATTYYAYVYDSCAAGSSSGWVSTSFTTPTLGINSITRGSFSIKAFPNPVEDQVTITITGANNNGGQLSLMDVAGRVISTAVANTKNVIMSMNGLAAGMYFIRYTDAAQTQTIKISKQ